MRLQTWISSLSQKHYKIGINYYISNNWEGAMNDRSDFLYPRGRYYGQFTPENLVFNANLQEFAQRVNYICALETGGKISSQDAYKQIKQLWKQLKHTKKQLGIGDNSFQSDEGNDEGNPQTN